MTLTDPLVAADDSVVRQRRASPSESRQSLCIVTGDLSPLIANAGVATANQAMALELRRLGFAVDVLYTRVHQGKPFCDRGEFLDHVEAFRQLGIRLIPLENSGNWNDWPRVSYLSFRYLTQNPYRLVFFDDMDGSGYFTMVARRTGNESLRQTSMCVTAHSARQWHYDLNRIPVTSFDDLRVMEMERRSLELADFVKAPSGYILDKYRSYGWKIAKDAVVLPNFLPPAVSTASRSDVEKIRELVFFGRLEGRKGLWMFCRALDRLKLVLKDTTVTFLGKTTVENGVSTGELILKASAAWPFQINLISNFSRDQAISYLSRPGRAAIIASAEDNSPTTILECIAERIPFLACDGGGGPELLSDDSRRRNLFKPSVDDLCEKLLHLVSSGGSQGVASFTSDHLAGEFRGWLDRILASTPAPRSNKAARRPVLAALVPGRLTVDDVINQLPRLTSAVDSPVDIELLVESPGTLASLGDCLPALKHRNIGLRPLDQFGEFAKSFGPGSQALVCICHVLHPVVEDWSRRAQICFDGDSEISALTGVRRAERGLSGSPAEQAGSPSATVLEVLHYPVGNAPSLFPLLQETNTGFIVLRSEALSTLAHVDPIDQEYSRSKPVSDLVHEIAITLYRAGHRFELTPDLHVLGEEAELRFEVYRLGKFLRTLPEKILGYAPGSDNYIMAKLGIDAGLEYQRDASDAVYLKQISDRVGFPVDRLKRYAAWEDQSRQFAAISHANGQADLAADLLATAIVKSPGPKPPIASYIASRVAETNVLDALRTKGAEIFNAPDVDGLAAENNSINLPLNRGGMSGFLFRTLDLTHVTHFSSSIKLSEDAPTFVRARIELVSLDREHRWSSEKWLTAGEAALWELGIPDELRGVCSAVIGAELTDWAHPVDPGAVSWTSPRFFWRG